MRKDNLVYENVVAAIGQTPLIRMNKIPKDNDIACQLFAKCDFFNPGGSSKDRIGSFMIEAAEKEGKIKPGDTLVESTSGNTGIGLALSAIIKNYKLIITIPDKMSSEKINTLKAMGAQVIVCPTAVPHEHPDSYVATAKRLGAQPHHFHIDQYSNAANVEAHYQTTALEIWDQMDKKIDYFFVSVGTGGTVVGCARRFKELDPNIKIIGIDPEGSILSQPDSLNTVRKTYKIEGIGQDCVPKILKRELVTEWVKINDKESFPAARQLIDREGLLVGGSCGSVLVGTLKYLRAKGLDKNPNLRCVLFLPDSIRNYMSKFLVDEWMIGNDYFPLPEEAKGKRGVLETKTILDFPQIFKKLAYYDKRLTVSDCLDLFKKGMHIIPIRQAGEIIGVVTRKKLINAISAQSLNRSSSCANCLDREFLRLPATAPLALLQRCLNSHYNVVLIGTPASEIFTVSQADIAQIFDSELKELI